MNVLLLFFISEIFQNFNDFLCLVNKILTFDHHASETRTIGEYLTDLGWKIDGEIASKEIGTDGVFVNVNVKDHAKIQNATPTYQIEFAQEMNFRNFKEFQTLVNGIKDACTEVESYGK